MARTVKDPEVRRNEILDAAQQLFTLKGYDQTSVQDILDAVGISKGAFYHYFISKEELLDCLVTRMVAQTMLAAQPILDDQSLDAAEKMETLFNFFGQLKTSNRRFFMDLARVVYRDENAVYRQKVMAENIKWMAPLVSDIIRQGVEQGVFDTQYVDQMGEILMKLLQSLSESLVVLLLADPIPEDALVRFERIVLAHEYAIMRLLGADRPLSFVTMDTARAWLAEAQAA